MVAGISDAEHSTAFFEIDCISGKYTTMETCTKVSTRLSFHRKRGMAFNRFLMPSDVELEARRMAGANTYFAECYSTHAATA